MPNTVPYGCVYENQQLSLLERQVPCGEAVESVDYIPRFDSYGTGERRFFYCFWPSEVSEGGLEPLELEPEPKEFFRVTRRCIVRLEHFSDILTYSHQGIELRLKDDSGQQVIVSCERVKGFREWLG